MRPYPFDPADYPDTAGIRVKPGTPVVDVTTVRELVRAVRSGYTAHSAGESGHAFVWQDRAGFKLQRYAEGVCRIITFLELEDAAEYAIACVNM